MRVVDGLAGSTFATLEEAAMAVMNTIELEGVSPSGWGDAAREALREAARTIRRINRLEILGTSASVEDDGIVEYRTQVRLYFTVEGSSPAFPGAAAG